uniref:Uncharacterized protein n=1 Tax=Mustela putorius furo TaxID=9669 RepID=M3Z3N4_MUSPF
DHDLRQRQRLNPLSHPGAPQLLFTPEKFRAKSVLRESDHVQAGEEEEQRERENLNLSMKPNTELDFMTLRS